MDNLEYIKRIEWLEEKVKRLEKQIDSLIKELPGFVKASEL
tara:strand:+ start:308 stop:430 length:123 start_codon:yes stop_codon:yes gene_type:complete